MGDKVCYIECDCCSMDHILKFTIEDWDGDNKPILTASLFLNNSYRSFWKRMVLAFKYLFGISHKNYEYVDIILNDKSVQKLETIIEEYKQMGSK